MICKHPKCINRNVEYESYHRLNMHIFYSHKEVTKEKYAELFETDEWIRCKKCNDVLFFQNICVQKSKFGGLCHSCRKDACHESRVEGAKRGTEKRKEGGFWSKEKIIERSIKAEATKSAPGGYYESEQFKNNTINLSKAGTAGLKEDQAKNPEKYKEATRKREEKKKADGFYNHDRASQRCKKSAKTLKDKKNSAGIKPYSAFIKAGQKAIFEDRKNNPEKYREINKRAGEKAEQTKRSNGYYESEAFNRRNEIYRINEANGKHNESKRRIRQKKLESGYYQSEAFLNFVEAGKNALRSVDLKKRHERRLLDGTYVRAAKKCHETMKKNGTYRKSKPEDERYKELCCIFGKENVKRLFNFSFVLSSGQNENLNVDFYVKIDETFCLVLQDGYWHGLYVTEESLINSKNPRDKTIHKTLLKDIEFNSYCQKNNINLIRFSDKKDLWRVPYFVCGVPKITDLFLKRENS